MKSISINSSIVNVFILILAMNSTLSKTAELLDRTNDGWTIFQPSKNTNIVYVSSSDGNDDTGDIYTIKDIGDDPFVPRSNFSLKPFKTFKAAFEKTRNNHPDWILVKRGDSFFESIRVRNGKNLLEPFLIAAYGTNESNPIFNTADKTALQVCCRSTSNIAIQGLDFYAHTRDPKTSFYISPDGGSGFNVYVSEDHTTKNILLEGNRFKFYGGSGIQGPGKFINIVLRRNSFLDSYSTTSHSQGLYAENVTMKLEENIFDHNGWLKQADKDIGKKQGAATIFNHNIYFANSNNVEIVNNVFLRSSSIQNKFTANKGKHSSTNIIIKNNLYLDGEIGISAGGNKTGAYRFKDYKIIDNVMLNIGRSQPTGRTLGWGLDITDWDGGIVKNNYFLNQNSPKVDNTFGIHISGTSQDITIGENIFNNLFNANALVLASNGNNKNITVNNNQFLFEESGGEIINLKEDLSGYSFKGNQYFHDAGRTKIYATNTIKHNFWKSFLPYFEDDNFKDWVSLTKENSSQWAKPNIKEQRTIETYLKSINKQPSIDNFISNVRKMSFRNWDSDFTAKQVNSYIKFGYTNN